MDEIDGRLAAMERAITALAQLASPAQLRGLCETLRSEAHGATPYDVATGLGAAEILSQALCGHGALAIEEVPDPTLNAGS